MIAHPIPNEMYFLLEDNAKGSNVRVEIQYGNGDTYLYYGTTYAWKILTSN